MTPHETPHPQHSKILNQCPLLRTLLGDRSQRCLAWPHRSRAQFAFLEAEFLLEQFRATSVVGVEKLAADGTASILKFESTLSEFRFALLFSRLKAHVEILPDDAFGPACYTPDLFVRFPNGLEVLVDVVLGSSGEPELTELLNELADDRGLSFDVELVVGLELSRPSVGHKERIQAKDLAAEIAQLVVVALTAEQLQGTEAGLVRVHSTNAGIAVTVERGPEARVSLYDDLESHDESWMATFGFRRTTYDVPAIGGGVSDVRWMKDDEQRDGLQKKLVRKAKRRPHLPPNHKSTPFLVAIDNKESDLTPAAILSELTGGRNWVGKGNPKPTVLPDEIAELADTSWRPLLEEWNYFDDCLRFNEFGVFFEQKATWAGELSGVLVGHGGPSGVLQWLPNPFAAKSRRCSDLLDIGLPLNQVGKQVFT